MLFNKNLIPGNVRWVAGQDVYTVTIATNIIVWEIGDV